MPKNRFREQAALLDKARDAILVYDLDTRVGFWNKSAERLYGWLAGEVIGRKVDEVLNKTDATAAVAARNQALESGNGVVNSSRKTKSARPLWSRAGLTLVSDAEGRPHSMLVINTDVTEKKAARVAVPARAAHGEHRHPWPAGIAPRPEQCPHAHPHGHPHAA